MGNKLMWSVMIPTYNPQDRYLRECITSAIRATEGLAQCGIEVVDDCSPNVDVEGLVRAIDPSQRVRFYRRGQNGGLAACWNECIARARGDLIHILHQDDLIHPAFYRCISECAHANPSAGMLFCRHEVVDATGTVLRTSELEQGETGVLPNWLQRISQRQRVLCPAVVVRRQAYQDIGAFRPDLRYVIDWEMWIRLAANYPVAYVPDALAAYRDHPCSETKRLQKAGQIAEDFLRCARAVEMDYAPAIRAKVIKGICRFAMSNVCREVGYLEKESELRAASLLLRDLIALLRRQGLFREMLAMQRWRAKLQVRQFLGRFSR